MKTKTVVFMFVVLALLGCGVPDEDRVVMDFKALFAKEAGAGLSPIVTSIYAGEGDSNNVYFHVEFDIMVERDVAFDVGWFKGVSARKGENLIGGEVVILYRKNSQDLWQASWHEVARIPAKES